MSQHVDVEGIERMNQQEQLISVLELTIARVVEQPRDAARRIAKTHRTPSLGESGAR